MYVIGSATAPIVRFFPLEDVGGRPLFFLCIPDVCMYVLHLHILYAHIYYTHTYHIIYTYISYILYISIHIMYIYTYVLHSHIYVCNTEVMYTYAICSSGGRGCSFFLGASAPFFIQLPCHVSKAPMFALSVCSDRASI